MVLGLVLTSALIAPDLSGWHSYSPEGSGLVFAMPGTVHIENKADETGAAKRLYKCYATAGNITYSIVWGDPVEKFAKVDLSLWEKARNGQVVQMILANTLEAAAKTSGGKQVFKKFGVRNDFPVLAEILDQQDGSASNIWAAFTKRGLVVASARGPRTKPAAEFELQFLNSLDMSARR